MVLEYIIVLLVDLGPSLVSIPMLPIEFEILIPSWAISNVPAHLISIPIWKRFVVLDQI
jgi:hypothetical protein